MTNELVEKENTIEFSAIERVVMQGDLSKLDPQQRVLYYKKVCESAGLNPFTRPFDYIMLNGKLTLYAKKDATEQLRKINGISIIRLESQVVDDLYIVKATASTKDGRTDEATGAVTIGNLRGDAKANAIMKAECVPIEYEILTSEGFKNVLDLEEHEMVASMNPQTHEIEWSNLLDVSIYHDIEVTHYGNSAFEFEITDGHKWATETNNGVRDLKPFSEIKSSTYLVLAGICNKNESILNEKEAATLGWIITDGTVKSYKGNLYRASICQSKEENFEFIDWCVSEMSFSKGKTDNRELGWKDQHWWYLSKASTQSLFEKCGYKSSEDLPKIIYGLGKKEREAMFKAMIAADGDKRGNFGKGNKNIIDAFQILCALLGNLTSKTIERNFEKGTKPFYLTRKLSYSRVAFQNLSEGEKRKTSVWCPTTKHGTWICRSDKGQVFVTGNTKAKRRVTLSISGMGWTDESEIETIPNARPITIDMATGVIEGPNRVECISADQVIEIKDLFKKCDDEYRKGCWNFWRKQWNITGWEDLPAAEYDNILRGALQRISDNIKQANENPSVEEMKALMEGE